MTPAHVEAVKSIKNAVADKRGFEKRRLYQITVAGTTFRKRFGKYIPTEYSYCNGKKRPLH